MIRKSIFQYFQGKKFGGYTNFIYFAPDFRTMRINHQQKVEEK